MGVGVVMRKADASLKERAREHTSENERARPRERETERVRDTGMAQQAAADSSSSSTPRHRSCMGRLRFSKVSSIDYVK